MRQTSFASLVLLACALVARSTLGAEPPAAPSEPRRAGLVVAAHEDVYVVDLGDEPGVGQGSVLAVYRQLPSPRGDAAYRAAGAFWGVGEATVISLHGGMAMIRQTAPASSPLPPGLDESGALSTVLQIGDRVRATGAVGVRPLDVRVTFPREALFGEADERLPDYGREHLRAWLRGLTSLEGPITVEVHARFVELSAEAPDSARALSAARDAPFGAAPGSPVVPVDGLHTQVATAAAPPPGDEAYVVERSAAGRPDVFHYVDPVTLAQRRGAEVAQAVAAHLSIPASAVQVRVVPRGISASYPEAVGYDRPGDQLRILAAGIGWSDPGPEARPSAPPALVPPADDARPHRRRLLERVPHQVSMRGASAP